MKTSQNDSKFRSFNVIICPNQSKLVKIVFVKVKICLVRSKLVKISKNQSRFRFLMIQISQNQSKLVKNVLDKVKYVKIVLY